MSSRSSCRSWLALDRRAVADDLGEDVRLAQDEDLVALFDVHLDVLPVLVTRAGADGEDLAALRLLLRRVGQYDAADGGLLFVGDLHDQPIAQRLQIHTTDLPESEFVTCLAL